MKQLKLTEEQQQWLAMPKGLPTTTHGNNLRKILSSKEWELVRRATCARARFQCELCGEASEDGKLDAHEMWYFDFDNCIQYLGRLVSLCPNCHRIQHALLLKFQCDKGLIDSQQAIDHFNKVSNQNITYSQFCSRVQEFFNMFEGEKWNVVMSKNNDPILEFLPIEFPSKQK